LLTDDAVASWREGAERSFAWADAGDRAGWSDKMMEDACKNKTATVQKDHINPLHYQGYVDDMQWLEVMSKLPRFKNPETFKGAVELQIRKYLDRNGKKDAELQELQKALFYMKYLVAYVRAGEVPILIKDVETILKG
jgi:hypothetical protein